MTGEKYVFDFTISKNAIPDRERCLSTFLTRKCKKWGYQLEKGEVSGYEHYQGRLSLKTKVSLAAMVKMMNTDFGKGFGKVSCTTVGCSKGTRFYEYTTKEETRIDGPWTDEDETLYIPRQIREMGNLRPFQKRVVDSANDWDTRHINYIYCPNGNIGKSLLVGYCRAHGVGRALPPVNDQKDLLRMVCDLPTSKMYLFDMPRSMNKDKLYSFYSAIETIKDGYAYDDRYKFREKVFDCPIIWVFANSLPPTNLLSKDRWLVWQVDEQYELSKIDNGQLYELTSCLIGDD